MLKIISKKRVTLLNRSLGDIFQALGAPFK